MFDSEKHLSLSELADIKLLQEFQDTFAKAMNVASITVDDKGPITRPSNFTDFCTKYTRGSTLGYKNCVDCDIKWGKIAAERGEPVIYTCHTGLTDFAVPIIVAGQHIGSILGGQVLTEKPDEKHFRKIAKELSIDEDEYISALRKIKIVPRENIEAAARLLYLVANAVSEIGHKNLQLFKKNRIESLYKIIMSSINATLNATETKKRIVNIIGQTLQADRCFIVEYDKTSDKFSYVSEEYLSSQDISSYKGINLNKEFPQISSLIKKGKQVVFDNEKNKNKEIQKLANEEPLLKANLGIPFHYGNELLGSLGVHYVKNDHIISQDEINLLSAVAAQVSAVIHQQKLYKNMKQTVANQDAILNNMPFMAWLKDENSVLLSVNDEYAKMCNTTINNVIGKTDFDFFPKEYAEIYVEEDRNVMETEQALSSVDPIVGPDGEAALHETFKSPVYDSKNNVVGTVGIARNITEKKESEVKLLQKQSELLNAYEREKINRTIIEILSSSHDKAIIKHQFVKNIGRFLKADRVFLSEFDPTSHQYLPVDEYSEYLSNSKEKSFVDYEWSTREAQEFIQPLLNKEEIIISDWAKYSKKNKKGQDFIALLEEADVKSSYNFPIQYQEKLMGYFSIEFTHSVYVMHPEEIELVRGICNQAGIALYHAELYAEVQSKSCSKQTDVSQMIDKIRDPLMKVNKYAESMHQPKNINAQQHVNLNTLNDNLKQLLSIIKDV